MSDINFSPWPEKGKSIWFTWRKGVWARVKPLYDEKDENLTPGDAEQIKFTEFWFPFLSLNNDYFHFYVGWKPITLADPKFYWSALAPAAKLFLQLSLRGGKGKLDV